MSTLFSLVIVLFAVFSPAFPSLPSKAITTLFLVVGTAFLLIVPLSHFFALALIQKEQKALSSHLTTLYRKDRFSMGISVFLFLLPLLFYLMAFPELFEKFFSGSLSFAGGLLLIGLSLDALHLFWKRTRRYINPFSLTACVTHQAHKAINHDQDVQLLEWIDTLTEIATKSLRGGNVALCHHTIDQLLVIIHHFLERCRNLSHRLSQEETKQLEGTDEISYTLFYVLQRLESLHERASQENLELTATYIITALGKIAINAGKVDLSLTKLPLRYLEKITKRAQSQNLPDAAIKTTGTLLEVAKALLTETDITYANLKDPFLVIINSLEKIAKTAFKQDKTINIKMLTHPFQTLRSLFQEEKAASHQDTPVILQDIDRVLTEFTTLETVMHTMPPIPKEE